jgi:NCAIR mutase (PurE)-related protein
MNRKQLEELLHRVHVGKTTPAEAVEQLKCWPAEQMEYACLDHHRPLRTGMPEVIYGESKTAEQIAAIMKKMLARPTVVMATRVDPDKASIICRELPDLDYHDTARMLTGNSQHIPIDQHRGLIGVISAGTSDLPVAEEAALTAQHLGNPVEKLFDVGVAGIHRLLCQRQLLAAATVLIVVAGMEGALPSVIGGLVDKPVIAVPTSVGYGTGFGGLAALLAMLNSCAPGIAVVNIDNGFGAGCLAGAINRKQHSEREGQ